MSVTFSEVLLVKMLMVFELSQNVVIFSYFLPRGYHSNAKEFATDFWDATSAHSYTYCVFFSVSFSVCSSIFNNITCFWFKIA